MGSAQLDATSVQRFATYELVFRGAGRIRSEPIGTKRIELRVDLYKGQMDRAFLVALLPIFEGVVLFAKAGI
jgi:hypothetical protein